MSRENEKSVVGGCLHFQPCKVDKSTTDCEELQNSQTLNDWAIKTLLSNDRYKVI